MSQNAIITKIWTKNDRRTAIADTLVDALGVPIDLSASTVVFRMVLNATPFTAKVDNAAATIDDATAGKVSYAWATNDLDTVALYAYWWIVTTGGKVEHFPGDERKFRVNVVASY